MQGEKIHQMKILMPPGKFSPSTEKSGTGKSFVSPAIAPIICWEMLGFIHKIAILPAFSSISVSAPS
ncbi:MAG: hypothetical protein J0G33_11945 [Afipia felis]|nr:hypothetical protein [Afipia felis]